MASSSGNVVDGKKSSSTKEEEEEEEKGAFLIVDAPVEPVLTRLDDFFSSPALTSAIADFMTENASKLEFRDPNEEQPMQNHDIFMRYSEVVENQLEEFLRRENIEMGEVGEACKRVQGSDAASCVTCIDYLVAATEYNSFMLLAYDFASMSMWDGGEGDGDQCGLSLEDYDQYVDVVGPDGAPSVVASGGVGGGGGGGEGEEQEHADAQEGGRR